MINLKQYTDGKTHDFYTFEIETEAKVFFDNNPEYSNVYYSYGWGCWIASKTVTKRKQ
ncbi:hypothetical protein D3C74_323280 [compost metagenome]